MHEIDIGDSIEQRFCVKKGATRAHTGHAEALFCDFKKSTSDNVKLDAEKIMLKRTEIQ